jgi:DNA polymerase-1
MQEIVEQAKTLGYVPTLWGRRRYIPELSSAKAPLRAFGERVARNSPIQGTAADLIKVAMVAVDRALEEAGLDARLILQVHDELIVESHKDCAKEAAQILRREMESIMICDLPLLAEANIAKNLLDSKG